MKHKILLSLCAAVVAIFSATTVFAGGQTLEPGAALFPVGVKNIRCTAPTVTPDNQAGFCTSFTASVKTCDQGMTMQQAYKGLLALGGGSLMNGCKIEAKIYGATWQACYGEWQCYQQGGTSYDLGGRCSGTGVACPQ